jgi:glutathionylspermidine synthase
VRSAKEDTMKDYENHYYNIIKMTINKRVTIDNTLNKLHEMQLDMIDQAVEYSDLQQAREVIKNIIDKK